MQNALKLLKRQQLGNWRQLTIRPALIDFASNDYLGLARCPILASSVQEEWNRLSGVHNGLGSTGSRLLTGNSSYIEMVEHKIARFHGYEAGLLFSCGYMANLGLLSAAANAQDIILFDAAIHASLHDGIHLSRARAYPFRHQNLEHLESRLKTVPGKGQRYICIESIYSTSGCRAPLQEICSLAERYGARVIVDEAHAVGCTGPQGKGLVANQQLTKQVFAQVVTFGKALGTYGAIILGTAQLRDFLINFSKSFIYTTALPFHVVAAIHCTYDRFPHLDVERAHLNHLIARCQKGLGLTSDTPIQSVPIPGTGSVKKRSQQLAWDGFDVRPLTSPTVRRGHECLRICLHSYNTEEQLSSFIQRIKT